MTTGPTVPPPGPRDLAGALTRNIEALTDRRRAEARAATRQEKLAQAITAFSGSMKFVYLHLVIYGAWIVINLGWVGLPKFDPSFVVLAMAASVEAIFLSTFVLISQNRTAAAADRRADLDLQINLLTEHELTRLTQLVVAIADQLQVALPAADEMDEITRDVAPEAVLNELDKRGL